MSRRKKKGGAEPEQGVVTEAPSRPPAPLPVDEKAKDLLDTVAPLLPPPPVPAPNAVEETAEAEEKHDDEDDPDSEVPSTARSAPAEQPAPVEAGATSPEPEPPPAALAGRPKPPVAQGAVLRCMAFEGGVGVAAKVAHVHTEEPMILLYILGLNRYWPIRDEDVVGDMWTHHPANYPAPGKDKDFDQRCRTAHPQGGNPLAGKARRAARKGHVWARVLTNVIVPGFTVEGPQRTAWTGESGEFPGEEGEFLSATVKSAPHAFAILKG